MSSGGFFEVMRYNLSEAVLAKIVSAKKIEARVWISDFEFPVTFSKHVQHFLDEVKNQQK